MKVTICNAGTCRARIVETQLFCERHERLVESDTLRVLYALFRKGQAQTGVYVDVLSRARAEILEKLAPATRPAFEWDTPAIVLALALALGSIVACSPAAPSPIPEPPSSSSPAPSSPPLALPPAAEPTYFAALSIASTVVCHPAAASAALELSAPIETYVYADPPAISFAWDFDDGDAGRFTSSAGVVRYRYRSSGWKTVNVTIADARGRQAHNSVQVLLLPYPPDARCR